MLQLFWILCNLVLRDRYLIRNAHELAIILKLHVAFIVGKSRIVQTVIHLNNLDLIIFKKFLDRVNLVDVQFILFYFTYILFVQRRVILQSLRIFLDLSYVALALVHSRAVRPIRIRLNLIGLHHSDQLLLGLVRLFHTFVQIPAGITLALDFLSAEVNLSGNKFLFVDALTYQFIPILLFNGEFWYIKVGILLSFCALKYLAAVCSHTKYIYIIIIK